MATPMRSTDFRSIVEPILNDEFDGIYDQRADEFAQVYNKLTEQPLDTMLINIDKRTIARNITDAIYSVSNLDDIRETMDALNIPRQ